MAQLWQRAEAAGHADDAHRRAAGAVPLAEGGLLAVGRHLELLGEPVAAARSIVTVPKQGARALPPVCHCRFTRCCG